MSLKVALDLDGVLANLHSVLLPHFSAKVGTPLLTSMITQWNWIGKYAGNDALNEDYFHVWEKFPVEAIEPYERNITFTTSYLKAIAKDVDVVTAHDENSEKPILKWLEINGLVYNELVLVGDSRKLNGMSRSVNATSSADRKLSRTKTYDIFIDDNPSLAEKIPKGKTLLLYDQPWNRAVKGTESIIRISSLMDAASMIAYLRTKE